MAETTRREFLEKTAKTAILAGVGVTLEEILGGCATVGFKETPPVTYSPLKDNKVQPPTNGCLVGLRRQYWDFPGKGLDKLRAYVDYCEKHLEQKPYTGVLYEGSTMIGGFPLPAHRIFHERGMNLYIVAKTFKDVGPGKVEKELELKDIIDAKHDKLIGDYAEGAVQAGEKFGGFFITTMEESNGNWYYWGQNPKFVPAWRHVWEIFENKGANRYATWVWEFYSLDLSTTDNPEKYYPGDQYVDWIGLSAFSKSKYPDQDLPFKAMTMSAYREMRKNHPQKPIMQAEFGKTNDASQARWLAEAYKTIKEQMPGMKAAIYYDNVTPTWYGDDHTLNEKSLKQLKEIFKEPYWIMAK